MIGRFARLGVYRELANSREFHRIAFAGALALGAYLLGAAAPEPSVVGQGLALASVLLNGLPIVLGAAKGLLRRRVNVDELVSLAIVATLAQGEFLSAAIVSFVMVAGGLVEQVTSGAARKAIQELIHVAPATVTILKATGAVVTRASEVSVGDRLLIHPGERVAVDGVIRKGATALDESSLTGESTPAEKGVGGAVSAGTLNLTGVIEVEATRVGEDTTLGRVIRLVSDAEAHKPETVRLIDRYARWFTPTVLACAALVWACTGRVDRAITVLIVGCPCALILAAPTAVIAAIGRAARSGILVKGGQHLEAAARTTALLFDKTGTLTEGTPRLHATFAIEGVDPRELLGLAASLEQHSTHPFARAILEAAQQANLSLRPAEDVIAEIGQGLSGTVDGKSLRISAASSLDQAGIAIPPALMRFVEEARSQGVTPLALCLEGRPLGAIAVADRVRPHAPSLMRRLRALGVTRTALLTGDHEPAAARIAREADVGGVLCELKPQDKLEAVERYQREGHTVMFVGDGVNDAPALAIAQVGVAMGAAGTDVALETANICLMSDDLLKLPFLIRLARRTLAIIKFNIGLGLLFNTAAVAAGAAGVLSPVAGALAHNVGSILVVLIAASIAFMREDEPDVQPLTADNSG